MHLLSNPQPEGTEPDDAVLKEAERQSLSLIHMSHGAWTEAGHVILTYKISEIVMDQICYRYANCTCIIFQKEGRSTYAYIFLSWKT
jgi:hypothetical protein